jgi:hypothetical protein
MGEALINRVQEPTDEKYRESTPNSPGPTSHTYTLTDSLSQKDTSSSFIVVKKESINVSHPTITGATTPSSSSSSSSSSSNRLSPMVSLTFSIACDRFESY